MHQNLHIVHQRPKKLIFTEDKSHYECIYCDIIMIKIPRELLRKYNTQKREYGG